MSDTMIEFPPGTIVRLTKFRNKGVVIRKVNNRDYLVRVGSTELRVAYQDLSTATGSPSSLANRRSQKAPRRKCMDRLKPVDLHGLNRAEAIATLEQEVSQAIMQGYRGLQVIHGIGGGTLKTTLFNYCSNSEVVADIQPDPSNPGVTRVYFFTT